MPSAERKISHLQPVEVAESEKVTIVCESPKSIFVVVLHNSIFGNCPKNSCSGPVVVDIPKNYRGTVKSSCGTCLKEVELSTTHILLAIGRPPINLDGSEKLRPITPKAI